MTTDEKLDELLRQIRLMQTGITNLGTRLEAVEGILGVDANAEKARSIVERIGAIETELKEFRAETQKEFRLIQHQFEKILGDQSRQGAAIADLEERVDKLDKQPA